VGTVRAADMDVNKLRERFGEAVEAVRFDFTDPSTFEETFRGCEAHVLHASAAHHEHPAGHGSFNGCRQTKQV
jgi:hypothetical protein